MVVVVLFCRNGRRIPDGPDRPADHFVPLSVVRIAERERAQPGREPE